ncbi:MAG: glycosyltransferase, partial [Polyangiaceae bacterium]
MRIVHVVQTLGMGGQERLILNLSRELVRRGHDVSVLSLTPGGEIRPEFGTIRVHDVTRKSGFDALIFGRMARTLNEIGPDAVHTHNPSPMFYAVPASRAIRVPSVVHTKHGANIYGRKSLRAVRVLVRALTAFVCVSEGTAEVAREKEHVPEKLLHVIPNGIPLVDFNANAETRARLRRELNIPEKAFVVGSVGRLAPEKDYPLLVRAMTPLLGENVRLV